MKLENWLANLDDELQRVYGSILDQKFLYNYKLFPVYIVDIDALSKANQDFSDMVQWLDKRESDGWYIVGRKSWSFVNTVGFWDDEISAEFKLIYGCGVVC